MSNENHRVLSRRGAHELTPEEVERVTGSEFGTHFTVILTGPGPIHDLNNDI